jgi:cytidine deaminase
VGNLRWGGWQDSLSFQRIGRQEVMANEESGPKTRTTMEQLVEAAIAVAAHAYAPYSGFRVGAALLLTSGDLVTGTNVENVSYGLTICAERSALVQAVARFGPGIRIRALAVINLNGAASPPCGACRQMLAEFAEADAPVCFPAGEAGTVNAVTVPFSEVLPFAFDMKLK